MIDSFSDCWSWILALWLLIVIGGVMWRVSFSDLQKRIEKLEEENRNKEVLK